MLLVVAIWHNQYVVGYDVSLWIVIILLGNPEALDLVG